MAHEPISGETAEDDRGERRVAQRTAAALHVRFESFDDFVTCYTSNVSRTGLFVPTDRVVPAGAVVALEIELPENGPTIKAIARVVYILDERKAKHTGRVPGMGMEFLDVEGEPFADQITAYLDRAAAAVVPTSSKRERARVLVVDDSETQRVLALRTLRAAGYAVLSAKDGLEGLGIAIREHPDLILSDVNMPKMDGWKLLRMLRSRPNLANTPVIFLTTLSGDMQRLEGYRLGVDDYLGKPFQGPELVARLERVLTRSRRASGSAGNQALRGDLSQVSLASILSLAEMERRSGSLLLLRRDQTINLFLRDGAVVRIDLPSEHDAKKGIERFFVALDWVDGQFELSAAEVSAEDEIHLPTSFVLLEHARRSDESS